MGKGSKRKCEEFEAANAADDEADDGCVPPENFGGGIFMRPPLPQRLSPPPCCARICALRRTAPCTSSIPSIGHASICHGKMKKRKWNRSPLRHTSNRVPCSCAFFFRSDETWEAGFFSIIDSCLLDFAQVDPPGTMGQHPLQVWLRAVPSPRPRPRPTCASRPLSLCPPLVPRPTALRALPDARVPRGGVPKGGDHDPSAQFARVHAQRHRARPQWRLRRALGRLRCHAASRPSADLSSLRGPPHHRGGPRSGLPTTGAAAIQSGELLSNFLEQLGDGSDFFGVAEPEPAQPRGRGRCCC